MSKPIHIVCGPTASGKSARALEMARELGGVIINADSQQLYRELKVLTARPSEEDEAAVPHRLYGVLSGDDPASAGKWLKVAQMEIDWAHSHGLTPIVTGGTGLYLKALMEGIADIPDIAPQVTAQAKSDCEAMGGQAFHDRLAAVDSDAAARLRPTDPQRLTRAWAVWLGTGKPLSYWQARGNTPPYPLETFQVTTLAPERDQLYLRCNERVVEMFQNGAVEEVRRLLDYRYPDDLPVMRIIGVPEIRAYLAGEISKEESISKVQQSTRNYAKRQMTWFRHQL